MARFASAAWPRARPKSLVRRGWEEHMWKPELCRFLFADTHALTRAPLRPLIIMWGRRRPCAPFDATAGQRTPLSAAPTTTWFSFHRWTRSTRASKEILACRVSPRKTAQASASKRSRRGSRDHRHPQAEAVVAVLVVMAAEAVAEKLHASHAPQWLVAQS